MRIAAVCLVAVLAFAPRVLADSKDWDDCISSDPEISIAACCKIVEKRLQSGRKTSQQVKMLWQLSRVCVVTRLNGVVHPSMTVGLDQGRDQLELLGQF